MILPKLIIGGVLGAALLIAPAARADVLDPVDGFFIAAQSGTLLWNHVDADRKYSLVDGDGTVLVSNTTADDQFDVSLGNDNDGRLLAVYSRCDGPCTLFAYDVAAGSERSLGIQGTMPSLSRGVLAFARGQNLYQSRLGDTPRLVAHVNGSDTHVDGVAASARGVAFVSHAEDVASAMYFKPAAGGKLRRLAFSRDSGVHTGTHGSPVWHGGRLYWAFSDQSDNARPNGWVMRYDPHTKRTTAARVSPGILDAVAFDGSTLITSAYFDASRDGQGQVATLDAPHFGAPPALAGVGH